MVKAKEENKDEKTTKAKAKKKEPVVEIVNTPDVITTGTITAEQVDIDVADGEDQTEESYIRKTPFGVEVWDPETKSTIMKPHG